jgi:Type II restriction endonuclease EcoO109I
MPRGHIDLPDSAPPLFLSKAEIYAALARVDLSEVARNRVLQMETRFRTKIDTHLAGLPAASARFQKFNTSPFVLLFHSKRQGYQRVSQVERDIIPAKVFSSMETSAGRMVEEVVLPVYGWEVVPSQMHSVESVLDGRKTNENDFHAVTLKSGPRCLNDEMAQQIGRDVVTNVNAWANNHGTQKVEFTYGVLYGSKRQSNKKDWHILRSIAEALPVGTNIVTSHRKSWCIGYHHNGIEVTADVRIGIDWWTYLGGQDAWIEMCLALIRACIPAAPARVDVPEYMISDLASILDTSGLPEGFNVAIIQQSQVEWLLFLARHFADGLVD